MAILCFWPQFGLSFFFFAPLRVPDTLIWLTKYSFVFFYFPHTQAIHLWSYNTSNTFLASNWWFCNFDHYLAFNLALFVPVGGGNTCVVLAKHMFSMFYLLAYPRNTFMKLQHFKSIIGFKIDDFVFDSIWLKLWHTKYIICIILFTYLFKQTIHKVTALQKHH